MHVSLTGFLSESNSYFIFHSRIFFFFKHGQCHRYRFIFSLSYEKGFTEFLTFVCVHCPCTVYTHFEGIHWIEPFWWLLKCVRNILVRIIYGTSSIWNQTKIGMFLSVCFLSYSPIAHRAQRILFIRPIPHKKSSGIFKKADSFGISARSPIEFYPSGSQSSSHFQLKRQTNNKMPIHLSEQSKYNQ